MGYLSCSLCRLPGQYSTVGCRHQPRLSTLVMRHDHHQVATGAAIFQHLQCSISTHPRRHDDDPLCRVAGLVVTAGLPRRCSICMHHTCGDCAIGIMCVCSKIVKGKSPKYPSLLHALNRRPSRCLIAPLRCSIAMYTTTNAHTCTHMHTRTRTHIIIPPLGVRN